MFATDLVEKFWLYVNKNGDVPNCNPSLGHCWIWTGAKNSRKFPSYGIFSYRSRKFYAHRLSYCIVHGEIPLGLQIDHLCRNKECVNPSHLEAVTSRENSLRGTSQSAINAKKTHCPKGHPLSGDNLKTNNSGRQCRICARESSRKAHQKDKVRRNKLRAARKRLQRQRERISILESSITAT